MKHAHVDTLETLYAAFSSGDTRTFLAGCSEGVTFQVSGKSKLAGKYTQSNFVSDFYNKLREFTDGTFRLELHDILASDLHAAVLVTAKLRRAGKDHEYRAVHVWRFEKGKPLAWYDYPRDLYQFDAIWS